MNTNMKELNMNELEQVSGGNPVVVAAAIVGIAAVTVKIIDFTYDCIMED